MAVPTGYLLCGTPRTGSTLLCSLLSGTGVLGRPASYFREPDETAWASRFNVPAAEGRVGNYAAFVEAVRLAATTRNGIFGARLMWGSLERVMEGLDKSPDEPDVEALQAAFGRLAFVHLVRNDIVAQAVSWARAEQTGYWQHGDTTVGLPQPDLGQMRDLVDTIREHNASWDAWFADNGIQPHKLTYEALVDDPGRAVAEVADRVRVLLPRHWQPASPHRKQADQINDEWSTLLRDALAADGVG